MGHKSIWPQPQPGPLPLCSSWMQMWLPKQGSPLLPPHGLCLSPCVPHACHARWFAPCPSPPVRPGQQPCTPPILLAVVGRTGVPGALLLTCTKPKGSRGRLCPADAAWAVRRQSAMSAGKLQLYCSLCRRTLASPAVEPGVVRAWGAAVGLLPPQGGEAPPDPPAPGACLGTRRGRAAPCGAGGGPWRSTAPRAPAAPTAAGWGDTRRHRWA